MKNTILLILFLMLIPLFAIAENKSGNAISRKASILQAQPVTYTCVMHPEIHANKPGKCPKCGMDLIKEKAKSVKKSVPKKQVAKPVVKQGVPVKTTVIETKATSDDSHQNHTIVPSEYAKVIEEPVKRIAKTHRPKRFGMIYMFETPLSLLAMHPKERLP